MKIRKFNESLKERLQHLDILDLTQELIDDNFDIKFLCDGHAIEVTEFLNISDKYIAELDIYPEFHLIVSEINTLERFSQTVEAMSVTTNRLRDYGFKLVNFRPSTSVSYEGEVVFIAIKYSYNYRIS